MNGMTFRRQELGLSRSALARLADLNQVTVGAIESGRLKPYDGQLQKIARVLGVSADLAHTLLEEVPSDGRA